MPQNDTGRLRNEALEAQLRSIGYHAKVSGWLTACCFPAVFMTLGLTQKGGIQLASWVFFIFLVGQAAFRVHKERSIIDNLAGSVATVVGESRKPLEAGFVNSLRYRFAAADGKVCTGKSGWTGRKLPHVGETVPILYKRSDPSENLPLFDFRFYSFNLLGLDTERL